MCGEQLLIRIGRVGTALYLVVTIALAQALFGAFTYIAVLNHNSSLTLLFRMLSVILLLAGLIILGWEAIESRTFFRARIFTALFTGISSALMIFAVKGVFMLLLASTLSPNVLINTDFFIYQHILVYFIPSFIVLLITGEMKNRLATRHFPESKFAPD